MKSAAHPNSQLCIGRSIQQRPDDLGVPFGTTDNAHTLSRPHGLQTAFYKPGTEQRLGEKHNGRTLIINGEVENGGRIS